MTGGNVRIAVPIQVSRTHSVGVRVTGAADVMSDPRRIGYGLSKWRSAVLPGDDLVHLTPGTPCY